MLRDKKFRNALLFFLVVVAIYFLLPESFSEESKIEEPDYVEFVTAAPQTEETAEPQTEQSVEPAFVPEDEPLPEIDPLPEPEAILDEEGTYDSKDEVALYIYLYGHLPSNYITKKQAEKLGWPGGSLEPYAPGKCIGGSHFGNYEGLLPDAKGRSYTECDIDTMGAKSRGAKRIIFSNDGLIYYTDDHYESFELLYGEP